MTREIVRACCTSIEHQLSSCRIERGKLGLDSKLGVTNPPEIAQAFSVEAAGGESRPGGFEVVAEGTLLPPLFPIPTAFTVIARWPRDEEFLVSIPTAGISVQADPGSLTNWGLSRVPTSEGVAPFEAVKQLDQSWELIAYGLTARLLAPTEIRRAFDSQVRDSGRADFRLVIDDPVLSPLPWEFLLRPGEDGFLAGSHVIRHLYRSLESPVPHSVPLPWLRHALRELVDPGLREEDAESPRLRRAIGVIQSEEGLEPTGVADADTRWTIDRRLRGHRGDLSRVVVLVTDREVKGMRLPSGYELDLIVLYKMNGFEIITVSVEGLSDERLRSSLISRTLAVVHVAAALNEAPSLGVHFDLRRARGTSRDLVPTAFASDAALLTVRSLDGFLKSLPQTELKPLVILDPPRPSSRFDAVRQLFLRNAFAAELYRLGNAPAVLGTGLQRISGLPGISALETQIRTVITALGGGDSIGSAADGVRRSLPAEKTPTLDDLLCPMGLALFAHDPESRVPGAGPALSPGVSTMSTPATSRTIHALLVGIEKYPSPIPTLSGCVNDIEAFGAYLEERVNKDKGIALRLKTLKDAEATREAVIQAFREHFKTARKGDVALFYYSGHGSQEPAPEEFWTIEPDRLDETLVCHDSRQPGCWDLADKEIAKLIGEVAAKGPHVAVILDCCHSGSGTREVEVVRRVETDRRRRPIESFILTKDEVQAVATRGAGGAAGTGWNITTEGRHVLFAACSSDQEAKEHTGNGRRRGAFSFFLGEALTSANGIPTYRDLFARTSALVSTQVRNQSPQLEATRTDDLDAVFLDGAIQPSPSTYTAGADKDGRWSINAGAAHGIPAAVGDDTTRLALFRFDAPAADLGDVAKAVATARVTEVLPASSRIAIDGTDQPDRNTTYKALILSLPTPPLTFSLEADEAARKLVEEAVAKASPDRKASLFVRVAKVGEVPEFRLIGRDGRFVITRPEDNRPLVKEIEGLDEDGAALAVRRLEHMARWTQIAALSNPAGSIQPSDVKLAILVDGKQVSDREIRLEYRSEDGQQVAPTFQVQMTNTSDRTLYCGLLDLTQRYGVLAGLLKVGSVKLGPKEAAWAYDGKPIPASVPDEVWQQGIIEYRDMLKLIVCTREFDARLLRQPNLDMPGTRGGVQARSLGRNGSLNRLMEKVQTRELGDEDGPAEIDDWQATDVSFTTVRPLLTTAVPSSGQSATLAGVVTLQGHPTLKANARLMSAPLSTRDLNNLRLPHQFYDDPGLTSPLTFTPARGLDPGLSVLELTDVEDPSVVTHDSPLRMAVPLTLSKDEHVVPLAYDGEFFLPLGRVERRATGETMIAIDRLPPPLADGRSLTGAIKIFFQKVISRVVGLDFPYPILGAIVPAQGQAAAPITDPFHVGQRVAGAGRILLFVHGIIGATDTMVPSVHLARLPDGQPLSSAYDLILTFDYENLNTTIEANARLLKERLAGVGLGPGHGKALDVVAHSMGGLVARWFIEQEGGKQVVRRLVMLGTPNGGSPWPKVFDWATVALGLGLNQLTAIPWPTTVLGGLSALIENPTVALNQMLFTSDLLAKLKKGDDPGIPYYLLAGNTSIIRAAVDSPESQKTSVLARFLARLTSPEMLHAVANPFFFGQPNDIAVSVNSMEAIAAGWKPKDVQIVACDHLSYFRDPAGLTALANVLTRSV
jgi:pimeloyl-ACP methyl ester carboxylesterase